MLNDEKTGLLTVYHGTAREAEFDVFDSSRLGSSHGQPSAYFGFTFTNEIGIARQFGQRIYSAYLNLENPYDMTVEEFARFEVESEDNPFLPQLITDAQDRRAELERKGYDGIRVNVFKNVNHSVDYWIAFHPGQIEILGSEMAEEINNRLKSSLLGTLESIRDTSDGLSKAVIDVREKLAEHEYDLVFNQPIEVRVLELGLRMIGGSTDRRDYGRPAYHAQGRITEDIVEKGVSLFQTGAEFLITVEKQGKRIECDFVKSIANTIRQDAGQSEGQLREMVGAIAGAAIDLATSLQHSMQTGNHDRSFRDSTHLTQETTAPSEENSEGYELDL